MSTVTENTLADDWVDSPIVGITLIVVGMSLFSIQDVAIRLMSGNLSVIQIMFIRGALALIPMAVLVCLRGGVASFNTRHPVLLAVRSLLMLSSYLLFYLAMAVMPIADVTAIFFVAPLITTAFSILFLKESVGVRRWFGVAAGFIGVLVIVQPGGNSLEPASLFVLAASFSYARSIMITRRVGREQSGASMAFYGMIGFVIVSGVGGLAFGDGAHGGSAHPSMEFLFRGWVMPKTNEWLLLGVCTCIATCGFYCLAQGYRVAPASVVAPFEYIAMPLAVIWGLVIWGEVPATTTFLGIALIIGSGLYVLHRESLQKRKINSGRGIRLRL